MQVPVVLMFGGTVVLVLGIFRYIIADQSPVTLESLRQSLNGIVLILFGLVLIVGGYVLENIVV